MKILIRFYVYSIFVFIIINAQNYEDKRCRCVCPSTLIQNTTVSTAHKLYIDNVPPSKCNCVGVVLPKVADIVRDREQEFCIRCECKYETRNTTVIKVVVIIVIWVIMLLVIYMGFLLCLKPLRNRKGRLHRTPGSYGDEDRHLLVTLDDED